jgi:hypothetical protein
MHSIYEETPIELVFPPQVPFSWTLRGAHARRLRAQRPRRSPTATSTAQASSFTDHTDRARREDECEHPLA